jgi:hypothetical protein
MKRLALALALLPTLALAQSMPNSDQGSGWYYGYQPGNVGFNIAFAAKQDWPMQPLTVATLPTCTSALYGQWYVVKDATSPTYNGALTGGGSVWVPVVCLNGAWTSH